MATRIYFRQQLDHDDFPLGSPGNFYTSRAEAEKDSRSRTVPVQSKVVWESKEEYDRWMAGDDSVYPKEET